MKACVSGECDSVLGDREKCRQTYREFIVYDNEMTYVDYIIWYRRIFPEDDNL